MTHDTDNMTQKSSRDISVVTGIFIQNEKGEIWFGRMPKWSDMLAISGGHLEYGETLEEGAARELKEETRLDADTLEFVGHFEMIDSPQYYKKKHFLAFNYRYRVTGRPEIEYNDEFSEALWLTKEEALAREDLNELTRVSLVALDAPVAQEMNIDYKDQWLRAQADYVNLQKETAAKRSEWATMSEWQILEEFIPVYDNFRKAFAVTIEGGDKQWESWKKGIEYIMKQFGDILKQHGIEEMETVGKSFDPTMHESVSEESSEDYDDGVIIREVDAGYKKGEKILKVARVVVNKK
ncbi:MAG: nucleotide exchange factor GrpE [Candidatus Magasanikbacteria bacterium CG1_02_41_34]|nr:MAG: nucleotide exchange factor GrpE [Candidatus Magasanikbacteria bacterium CG1_02_41_34]